MSNITLHIERLVVEGIPLDGAGPRLMRAAVEAELTRLISLRGLAGPLRDGVVIPGVPAPAIQMRGGESPAALGRQIAGAVYGGIGR